MCIPNAAPEGPGPAMQIDRETFKWLTAAQNTVAPSWRSEVTICSFEQILEHASAKSIERVSPRPLLIREACERAGQPKESSL
jgi:hypothetical protein